MTMIRINIFIAAAVISTVSVTSTLAYAQFSKPAAFEGQHPDRDALNGAQLTPTGRAALEAKGGARGAFDVTTGPIVQGAVPSVRPATRRRH